MFFVTLVGILTAVGPRGWRNILTHKQNHGGCKANARRKKVHTHKVSSHPKTEGGASQLHFHELTSKKHKKNTHINTKQQFWELFNLPKMAVSRIPGVARSLFETPFPMGKISSGPIEATYPTQTMQVNLVKHRKMTSASPGNLGPVTGVWLFFFWGGWKGGNFLAVLGRAEGKIPYDHQCFTIHHLLQLRCSLQTDGPWPMQTDGSFTVHNLWGHTFSKSISICFISPAKVVLKAKAHGGGPSGFPAIFKASQESHIYHRPCCWLVDPVLNTGLLWITSVGMAGAGSCLKCLKFRGGHHGETNKNIQKKTRSVTVLLERILHPLFS